MKISFDIGGVLSKYPQIFRPMIIALIKGGVEVHVITDMHDMSQILKMLAMNDLGPDIIPPERVHSADYKSHGEYCKSITIKEQGIDLHIDDFPGYCAAGGNQLLMWPNPDEPYFSDVWKTDGTEDNFGRRVKPIMLKEAQTGALLSKAPVVPEVTLDTIRRDHLYDELINLRKKPKTSEIEEQIHALEKQLEQLFASWE